MAYSYKCLTLQCNSQWGVIRLYMQVCILRGFQDVCLPDLLTLMSQICILVLLGPYLDQTNDFGCSVFCAQLLHGPKLLSSGLSTRHYQGQNVTGNYTSLPPNHSLRDRSAAWNSWYIILSFLANQMKPLDQSTLGSTQLSTHDWLKGHNKMVLAGISNAGGHFKFTTLYFFLQSVTVS